MAFPYATMPFIGPYIYLFNYIFFFIIPFGWLKIIFWVIGVCAPNE